MTKAVLLKVAPISRINLSIVLKELKETRGWLKFIPVAALLPGKRIAVLLDECEQLIKITGKSIATAKTRAAPGKNEK